MRHKRAFEQSHENGRLAFESCHQRGTAGPSCPNNRRRFEQAFERAWRASNRSGKPLSLLVVDADHFKRVNDRYGHAVGDEVLKGLARCLLAIAHRPGDLACRIGGEEFVILLPDTDAVGALRIARRVHEAVRTLALPSAVIVVLSRRIDKPDGSFGGVVLGSLKLSYFSRLFNRIGLGQDGAINLYLREGTRVVRHPYAEADIGVNIAGTPNFDRFVREGSGAFVGTSVRDGVERHYAFTQVGAFPLILNVALSTREIEAEWRMKAFGITAVVLVLCGLTIALSLLFGRELRRRAEMHAEMARLSRTDALTGLANRRRFEHALARAVEDARRTGKPLSLLVVDADHFKRCNDTYGHAVGDEVLRGLARCLSASVHRPGDLACRVGGEEFAVLLPGTDADGALSVAREVHAQVSRLVVSSASIAAGAVTVSIGAAVGPGDGAGAAQDLYRLADAALYEAKAGGRNQTRRAAGMDEGHGRAAA